MKQFILEKSDADIISHGGLSLIGLAIKKYTNLTNSIDKLIPLRHGTKHSDIIKIYTALLCIGKNDFEAINTIESEYYFTHAMDVQEIPSESTLRQRMDTYAKSFLPIVEKANLDFLINIKPELTPIYTGHRPLDVDVTPMDNSGSKKEGVSRTYKGHDGYAPMPAYLGQEGYCIKFELREGKQHCQSGTPEFLKDALKSAQKITNQPILLRLDSGNDAIENIDVILDHNANNAEKNDVDFLIKWNPRKQNKDEWLKFADEQNTWTYPREGKRVSLFRIEEERVWRGHTYKIQRVMQVIERSIDKFGQYILIPEIEIQGWWTSLLLSDEEIIQLYCDHGTSEQFHSEFKTDMDIERLPSGKFDTNALVLGCSMLAYNILRWIGQNGLLGPDSPKRKKAKRRRIKTVIQELMYVAVRIIKSSRRIKLAFGRYNVNFIIFEKLHRKLLMN
ncbi:IS1380 family transposase [Marinicellulosiphila megalodicopiae]|uniref:IS1380 family transposase n=1 Tax=Marinicellulosiphila megalodicopiae TaxID=2724896 RepID=UPI003BAEB605